MASMDTTRTRHSCCSCDTKALETMSWHRFAFAVWLLAIFIPQASMQGSLQCHSCRNMHNYADCTGVVTCDPAVHSCFVEEKVDSSTRITYDMGCENKTTCSTSNTAGVQVIGRQLDPAPLSVTSCFKCCDTDLCNKVNCKDLCMHNPCKNGATCTAQRYGNDTTCHCPPGYTGQHCEMNVSHCLSRPCQNGGTCDDDGSGGFRCHCTLKTYGSRCQYVKSGSVCMQCNNVVHPILCKHEVFCPGEECYTDEVDSNGKISYNLGCRSKQDCDFYNSLLRPGRDDHVILKCSSCCATDHCNQALCTSGGAVSCFAHKVRGYDTSGIYVIDLKDNLPAFPVYCDMETDRRGWIVFQRRKDGSENFYRDWDSYKNGFGNLTGEFWLGNEYIYRLNSHGVRHLRVDMSNGIYHTFAQYNTFYLGSETSYYKLHVYGYSGPAVNGLYENGPLNHNNKDFSTWDRDHDESRDLNCAKKAHGGWWYSDCFMSNLNGPYNLSNGTGIEWGVGSGSRPLTFTEMKME